MNYLSRPAGVDGGDGGHFIDFDGDGDNGERAEQVPGVQLNAKRLNSPARLRA